MTVLITGGAGFIGLATAEALIAQGEAVVLFDRSPPPAALLARLAASAVAVAWMPGDIRSAADVDAALQRPGVDRVVHAAAITPDNHREARDPMAVTDVNIGGTVNLLQRCAASERPLKRVLVLSSVAVYGIAPPVGETYDEATSRPAPAALYGITKLAAEQAALRLADLYGLDLCVARLGPVFGPWEHATGVRDALSPHAQVIASALAGEPVLLPRGMRADWIYSRDAARALAGLLLQESPRHRLYNVGGAVMTDLAEWCELLGYAWRLARPGETCTLRYGLPVDRAALDIRRLRADTGWAPAFDLSRAAADHVAFITEKNP